MIVCMPFAGVHIVLGQKVKPQAKRPNNADSARARKDSVAKAKVLPKPMQVKDTLKTKAAVKTGNKDTAKLQKSLPPVNKRDSVNVIDPKLKKLVRMPADKARELNLKPIEVRYVDKPYEGKKQITYALPPTTDSVIILRNGKQRKDLFKANATKADTPKIVRIVDESCKCVSMKITAPDTLGYETYVNYGFIFKNNCKELVYVNSAAFSFLVFNPNGTPAPVLRKLAYTKQFKYPDFVPLSPGEEYEFRFGDDPFFQYNLRRGWKYKFSFNYHNPRKRPGPTTTFSCSQYRDKMIVIK